MHPRRKLSSLAIGVALAVTVTAALAAPEYSMVRWTVDAGGGTSSDGRFELTGTIGQPDAGSHSGGGYTLTGGFWFQIPPGDCEEDGDVDLLEHQLFTTCVAGPLDPVAPACLCFDVDRSGTVDLADVALIQASHTGP